MGLGVCVCGGAALHRRARGARREDARRHAVNDVRRARPRSGPARPAARPNSQPTGRGAIEDQTIHGAGTRTSASTKPCGPPAPCIPRASPPLLDGRREPRGGPRAQKKSDASQNQQRLTSTRRRNSRVTRTAHVFDWWRAPYTLQPTHWLFPLLPVGMLVGSFDLAPLPRPLRGLPVAHAWHYPLRRR